MACVKDLRAMGFVTLLLSKYTFSRFSFVSLVVKKTHTEATLLFVVVRDVVVYVVAESILVSCKTRRRK